MEPARLVAAEATALVATALLLVFGALGAYDTAHYHFRRYGIHRDPRTRREHALHTVGACLFPLSTWLLFCRDGAGASLLAGVALTLVALAVELVDVFEEGSSRVPFGGLPSAEYALHFVLSFLRGGFTASICAHRLLSDETHIVPRSLGWACVAIAFPVALAHLRYLPDRRVDLTSRPGV